jgi:hypothetical protein
MRAISVYEPTEPMSPIRKPDYLAYAVLAAAIGSLGVEIWALVRALGLLLSR